MENLSEKNTSPCQSVAKDELYCDSCKLASLFESALESHEKNHETSPERAKDES
jgi:hypothetical protein